MAKRKFNILPSIPSYDDTEFALKEYYQNWRRFNRFSKAPFVALYNSFMDTHLKELDGGAIKLYLYFAFAANNGHGHSWHSVTNIAKYFGVQSRTVDNWIKVLVERDLVYRDQKGKKSHTTYLLPYSNTLIHHPTPRKRESDDQDLLQDLMTKIMQLEEIYGAIIRVHHIFQWGNEKGKVNQAKSTQILFIISQRKSGVLIGHVYPLKKSDQLSINELNIEDVSIFNSHFEYNGTNVVGLALPHDMQISRRSNADVLLELLKDLTKIEEWQLEEYHEVKYGKKDDFFRTDESDGETAENEK